MSLSLDIENGDIGTEIEAIPETYPDPAILIYTDKDDVENETWDSPAGGSNAFTNTLKEIAADKPKIVPALLGDGGGRVTGADEGTSFVRLFSGLNNTVVAQNRLLHDIENRPVWVQVNPKNTSLPKFQIVGTRVAADGIADSDSQRTYTQHFAIFNAMTVTAAGVGAYSAPSFVAREYTLFIKSVSAHLLTAGSTVTTVIVYLNNVAIKTVSLAGASQDTGRLTVTAGTKAEDGDVIDMAITVAGTGAAGLSVQVEMWRFGI